MLSLTTTKKHFFDKFIEYYEIIKTFISTKNRKNDQIKVRYRFVNETTQRDENIKISKYKLLLYVLTFSLNEFFFDPFSVVFKQFMCISHYIWLEYIRR